MYCQQMTHSFDIWSQLGKKQVHTGSYILSVGNENWFLGEYKKTLTLFMYKAQIYMPCINKYIVYLSWDHILNNFFHMKFRKVDLWK